MGEGYKPPSQRSVVRNVLLYNVFSNQGLSYKNLFFSKTSCFSQAGTLFTHLDGVYSSQPSTGTETSDYQTPLSPLQFCNDLGHTPSGKSLGTPSKVHPFANLARTLITHGLPLEDQLVKPRARTSLPPSNHFGDALKTSVFLLRFGCPGIPRSKMFRDQYA